MARELIWNIEDHPTFAEAQEKLGAVPRERRRP